MPQEKQVLVVPDYLTVRDLANLMKASPIEVMKQLIANGIMASINQQIDYDTAAIVLGEMGFEAKPLREVKAEEERQQQIEALPEWRKQYATEDKATMKTRPPVVTVLGHVDHGKTSLLDAIRKAQVAEGEAGGITQHIGAYQVEHNGQKITFLDTPGHAAFTAMRARGAKGADIAVLVVAADDGVMPTTREALAHARAAGVPIVVALNKIDKPNANPDRVKQQLSELGLTPDDWDGDTMVIPVSAKTKLGIDDLLEAIAMTASEHDISANPNREARGVVLEARRESGRGPIATLLVQNGTLHVGDFVVAGIAQGKIKAMFDEKDRRVKEAEPSRPVLIMGLNEIPQAGDEFEVVKDQKRSRALADERRSTAFDLRQQIVAPVQTLESLFAQFRAGTTNELRLILKVDMNGSLEPVVNVINSIETEPDGPKIKLIDASVGNVTENDVNLAQASDAIIISFNTEIDSAAKKGAENYGIDIRNYSVVYKLEEDMRLALKGLLAPVYEDKVIGRAEVRALFKIPKVGTIAGSYVLDGVIRRNAKARVLRGRNEVAPKQTVSSLKRLQNDEREVKAGFECGIGLADFNDFAVGDIVEFLVSERVN